MRIKEKPRITSHVKNRRSVKPAVQAINYYTNQQSMLTDNAMEASQITGEIYTPLKSGDPCTCRGNAPLLNSDGDMTDDVLQNLLVDDDEDIPPPLPPALTDKEILKLNSGSSDLMTFTASNIDLANDDVDDEEDPDEYVVDSVNGEINYHDEYLDDGDYLEYSSESCAVCYGTGRIGGYSMRNHVRVYCTPHNHVDTFGGMYVDTSTSPHTFGRVEKFGNNKNGEVTFSIKIPVLGKIKAHRVMNNKEFIHTKDYTLWIDSNGIRAKVENLNMLATGTMITLVIVTNKTFSHIEFKYQVVDKQVPIDMEQVRESDFTPTREGDFMLSSIQIGSYIQDLSRYSIIRDSKYNKLWYVTGVQAHRDNTTRRVLNWDLDVRLIQNNELSSLIL